MRLLYLLRIIFILFLFSIINSNILYAKNTDFSDTKCNFPTGKYYKELSDLSSFQSIDIKVNNYTKWVENSLAIITSAKDHKFTSYLSIDKEESKVLKKINWQNKKINNFDFAWRVWDNITDYRTIDKKYKKKFNAKVTVRYDFGTCVYNAKIRQTGDINDHIVYNRDGLKQSLSIKLKEGNIANIVNFKLFNRISRTSEREILSTLLFRELGFLAPRTRYVNVKFNGTKNEMFFQENPVKEFLEHNLRREAPMFEGDETFLYDDLWKDTNKDLYKIALTRLENKRWVLKGKSSLKMALKAYPIIQNLYMEQKATPNSTSHSNIQYSLNLDSLTKANKQARQSIYEYEALLLSMGGQHAMSSNNRKWYWNPLLGVFEPIYYDGSFPYKVPSLKSKSFQFENDNTYYFSEDFLQAVDSLIFKINELDDKKFVAKAMDLCGGYECVDKEFNKDSMKLVSWGQNGLIVSFNVIENYLPSIKESLQNYKYRILNYMNNSLSEKKHEYENKEVFEIYKKRLFIFFPNSNLYFIDMKSIDDQIIKAMECNNVSCIQVSIDAENIVNMMKSTTYDRDKQSVLGGIYNEEYFEVELTYIDSLNTNIKHSLGSKVTYNSEKRILEFFQKKHDDWFLLSDIEIRNLSFEMISNFQGSNVKLDSQRFNKFGLTGCLNFFQVNFIDTKIKTVGGGCEDSVNIIKSSGKIKDINISNASSDALDVDFSNINFEKMTITNAINDCFDVSTGKYFVDNAVLKNCGDKGISVGEASKFKGSQINVIDANVGISSKDSSISNIQSFVGDNIDLCFEAYQKKQEFFGAQLLVEKSNCTLDSFFADKNSFVIIDRVVQ